MGGYIPASREVGYGVGGYIPASREVGYQMGGLAEAMMPNPTESMDARLTRPMGGVPPRVAMQVGGRVDPGMVARMFRQRMGRPTASSRRVMRGDPRRGPMPTPPPGYGSPEYIAEQERMRVARQASMAGQPPGTAIGGPLAGRRMPMRAMPPVPPRMMPIKGGPRMMVPPSAPPGGDMPGPMGGPRVPPNLRGMLQRERMMNRPRRGIPGPAGAGGAPNRVGQSDQQGGLARALQRGTGRPPMSRRQGFYR